MSLKCLLLVVNISLCREMFHFCNKSILSKFKIKCWKKTLFLFWSLTAPLLINVESNPSADEGENSHSSDDDGNQVELLCWAENNKNSHNLFRWSRLEEKNMKPTGHKTCIQTLCSFVLLLCFQFLSFAQNSCMYDCLS